MRLGNNRIVFYSGKKTRRLVLGSTIYIPTGATVTYMVDSGVSYTEQVENGANCLSPTTFTPSKSGYIFAGWAEDTTASDSAVLTSKVMEESPITLYAVFKKSCEAKFVSYNSAESKTITGYAYYNNGNNTYFTGTAPNGSNYNGWSWIGWSTSGTTTANASVGLNNGSAFNCGNDTSNTFYGLYQKTCRLYCKSSGSSQTVSGTAYYNASGTTKGATVTLPTGAAHGSWTWRGWSANGDTAANAAVYFANGETIDISTIDGMTIYGLYQITLYLYAYISGTKYTGNSGVAYYNVAGNASYPTVTYPNPSVSGGTFKGWSVTAGNATVSYSSLASGIQLSSHLTVYAVVKYNDVVLKSGSTRYERGNGVDQNVITGIDGSKYSSLSIAIGDAWVETGRWAEVCSARAIVRVKTSSGTTYTDTVLHEMCWESGHWTGEPYQEGTPIRNQTITMSLYPGNVGQMLAVVFDGDSVDGAVYVNTVTAIGKTAVG